MEKCYKFYLSLRQTEGSLLYTLKMHKVKFYCHFILLHSAKSTLCDLFCV